MKTTMTTIQEENVALKLLVRELLAILNTVEISDNGNEFHPTTISSCRVITLQRIQHILSELDAISSKDI